ncbi:MAG: ketoacyl-ACP synthase III [Thermoguttaceae bacterium]|jgi:3-oxoacyl-[acyl-carrier-protein] synthase-3|nr:ketoacyl-ACP synthase III [Thermoguttaceae bacterium]
MGVRILGLGSAVPDQVIHNEDLAARGFDAEWILKRSGIQERRHAPPEIATSDLAVAAARRCLDATFVEPEEIDLVLVGTYTPDMPLPSTACLVQDRLGLRAPAMDLHAACTSFVYALITGMQFVATGCSRRALVIGADCNSRVVNPNDVRTFPLFGDAAGAVVLAPGTPQQGLLAYAVGADGSGADLLCQRMGGTRLPFATNGSGQGLHYLHMEGRAVFKWAVRVLEETVSEVLQYADLPLDEVDLVIFHQANLRIIDAAAAEIGLDPAKVYNNLQRYGNTAAASIPLALDEAFREGRIEPGSRVLVSGFGAGLTWATALVQW